MCGSATLTMVVSRTWISVADITASVTRSLSLIGCRGHQDAAGHFLEEGFLIGSTPPARHRAALLVSQHDEIRADALRGGGDAIDGRTVLERAVRGHSAIAKPL